MKISIEEIQTLRTEDEETGCVFVALQVNRQWFIVYERDDEDTGDLLRLGIIDKAEDFAEFIRTYQAGE